MSDKEFNEIWNQLQKRKTKLIITSDIIEKIKILNLDYFDTDESILIRDLHKELLTLSMKNNNSDEVGMLINLIDWSKTVIYGTQNGITFRNSAKAQDLMICAPKKSLLFFHNHPANSVFSEKDLESFLISDSILMMSVICNNGRQYFLTKSDSFEKEKALIYYDNIFQNNKNGCIKEFLRTCKKIGLIFKYGGE